MIEIMSSWRGSASQLYQDDLDALLSVTLMLAQEMLEKSGEFYPFRDDEHPPGKPGGFLQNSSWDNC